MTDRFLTDANADEAVGPGQTGLVDTASADGQSAESAQNQAGPTLSERFGAFADESGQDSTIADAFGSLEQRVTELPMTAVGQVQDDLQQDVLIFDWWVRNADRCLSHYGGNPNLFWEPGEKELVVIDHNQAFDLSAGKRDFSRDHVFAAQTRQLSGDFFRRDDYDERLSKALKEWPIILNEIPASWWFVDEEQTLSVDFDKQTAYELLKDYETDEFWNWT